MNVTSEPTQGRKNECKECPYEGVKKAYLLCRDELAEETAETLGYWFSGGGDDPSEPVP